MESTPVLATSPVPDEIAWLAERFPACFDLKRRRPLKIGISQDLIALQQEELGGMDLKRAIRRYCTHPRYRKMLKEGAIRIDLQGQPAGVVTAEEAENARAQLERTNARREGRLLPQPAPAQAPPTGTATTSLSNDTSLPKDHLVPGRLELTVKFSELPKPLAVQSGLKIGIQTGEGIVSAILPPKVWKKLEQGAQAYPQWVAALSGALEQFAEGEIKLKHPALQIFEKKPKPQEPGVSSIEASPTPTAVPLPPASNPGPATLQPEAVVSTPLTMPAPADAQFHPTAVRATLGLKGKGQKAG